MEYPEHAYKNNTEWLKDVRKRWVKMRKTFATPDDCVQMGCLFYPKEVYEWINQFRNMDALMKNYYNNKPNQSKNQQEDTK